MIREVVRVATLKPDKIAHYDAVHAGYPPSQRERLAEAGYCRLDIYRFGTVLFMIVTHDDERPMSDADTEIDQRWRDLTDPCFATLWEEASQIFAFSAPDEAGE